MGRKREGDQGVRFCGTSFLNGLGVQMSLGTGWCVNSAEGPWHGLAPSHREVLLGPGSRGFMLSILKAGQ